MGLAEREKTVEFVGSKKIITFAIQFRTKGGITGYDYCKCKRR